MQETFDFVTQDSCIYTQKFLCETKDKDKQSLYDILKKEYLNRKEKGQLENNFVKYDSLTQQNVSIFVEKMPAYKDGDMGFMADFGKYFHYKFQANEDIKTILRVQFVIDTKGRLIGARIYDKKADELTDFEKAGLKALNLMQSWQAGEHNGKLENVLITKVIHIDFQN
jgi:hypothetical protein